MKKFLFSIFYLIIIINKIYSQSTPVLMPGFPMVVDSNDEAYNNGPIVADFNNDGQNEIMIATGLNFPVGRVYLIDSKGIIVPNYPKIIHSLHSNICTAAGDIDGDGKIDIVVKADSLYVFNYSGNSLPGFPVFIPLPPFDLADQIALYDLDNDKNLEIILARGDTMTVINHNGTIRKGWPIGINEGGDNNNFTDFAIGDLNNNNVAEIILPFSNFQYETPNLDSNKIFIYEPDGSQYKNSPIISDSNYYFDNYNYPIIYKNNNQNYFSILSNYKFDRLPGNYKTRFSTYNNNCQIINQSNYPNFYNTESMTMGKLESTEPFFLCGDIFFTLGIKNDGNLLPGYPKFVPSSQYRNHNIGKLTDVQCFESAGLEDTLGGMGYRGYLRFWEIGGQELKWSPLRTRGYEACAASFCDLDNDGQAEVLVITNQFIYAKDNVGLYVWTLPGVPYSRENFPWPMFGHDRYRTNQFAFIPPDEPVGIKPISTNVPDKFTLSQNYPNPFNPRTKIKFEVPSNFISQMTNVKLIIYNVLGKKLQELVNEKLSPGSYEVTFDGSNLSSGVYFYRLTTENFSETRRMMLVK